jgi:hypothetical protein
MLVPLGRAKGFPLGSCNQWFCSACPLRDSLQGAQGCVKRFHLYPNEPASHFPQRAGYSATGRLHCCLCNFSRVTHVTQVCKATGQTSPARNCDFLRITTRQHKHKPTGLWKPRPFCGKGRFGTVSKSIPECQNNHKVAEQPRFACFQRLQVGDAA